MPDGYIMPCWWNCGERTGYLAATTGAEVEDAPPQAFVLNPNPWWQGYWWGWNRGMCDVFDGVVGRDARNTH